MKRFIGFLFLALVLFAFVPDEAKGQTVRTDSTELVSSGSLYVYQIYTAGTLSGTDTVVSKSFGRNDFDSTYSVFGLFSSATDSAKVTVKYQLSPDGTNWYNLDTVINSADTTTLYTADFVTRITAKYYRYLIKGITGNGYTTTFKVWAFYRRE